MGNAGPDGLRTLIEDAVRGLTAAEREVIELHLSHGLEAAEIATVLGMSRQRARGVVSRAMDQLQACLGVLLAGRAGRADCAQLAGMLTDWDENLTPELRWWVHGHVKRCRTCTARRVAELSPALLLGLAPDAAIAAAAQDSLRLAAGPPAELRAHTLALAAGRDPSAVAYRTVLLGRPAAPGRHHGPAPLRGRGRAAVPAPLRGRGRAAVAACVVLGVVIAGVAIAMTSGPAPVKVADGGPLGTAPTASAATTPATSAPTAAGPRTPAGSRTPHARHTSASPAPKQTRSAAATPTAAPPPTPGTSPTPSSRPTAHPTPTPPPTAGTLLVNPPGGQLQVAPFGATITLTARGGSVTWSVAVSDGSGRVGVWPSSGKLQSGNSVTVRIFASRHASGRRLTVSPAGAVFTLVSGFPSAWPLSLMIMGR